MSIVLRKESGVIYTISKPIVIMSSSVLVDGPSTQLIKILPGMTREFIQSCKKFSKSKLTRSEVFKSLSESEVTSIKEVTGVDIDFDVLQGEAIFFTDIGAIGVSNGSEI